MGKQGVSGSSNPGTKDWQCTDEEQVLQAAWGLPGKDQGEDRGIVPAAGEDGQADGEKALGKVKEGPAERLEKWKLDLILSDAVGASKRPKKWNTWLLSVVKLSFMYFALVVPKHAEQILFMTSGKICVNLDIIFDN